MDVYVVIDLRAAGWDCVLGVFSTYAEAKLYCADCEEVALEEWDASKSMLTIYERFLDLSDA